MEEKKIREIVDEANRLSKVGKNKEALAQLNMAFDEINLLSEVEIQQSLLGLTWHYQGSTLQRMGRYDIAVAAIEMAIAFREKDPIARAYSVFQLFICKVYGDIAISDEEVKETKMALLRAMTDDAATIADIGNMMQNLAYIEQVRGDTEKAILFYDMTLASREMAHDERGRALTYARLAECHKEVGGEDEFAKMYAQRALEYFENTGDKERIEQVKKVLREIQEQEDG